MALLDERLEVGEEDWELAGVVMKVSDRTREWVIRVLAEQEKAVNEAQAAKEARRAVVVKSAVELAATARVTTNIERRLGVVGDWVAASDLRKMIAHRDRPHFEAVMDALLVGGKVDTQEVNGGVQYRLRSR